MVKRAKAPQPRALVGDGTPNVFYVQQTAFWVLGNRDLFLCLDAPWAAQEEGTFTVRVNVNPSGFMVQKAPPAPPNGFPLIRPSAIDRFAPVFEP